MNILGIETSCDETSAAIVTDGRHIRANIIASQADLHARYGGVVPEVASRKHVERMLPVVQEALDAASMTYANIDALAVTNRPGLLGALLVGVSFAKAFCYARNLPLVGVHHLEGHVYSNFLAAPDLLDSPSPPNPADFKPWDITPVPSRGEGGFPNSLLCPTALDVDSPQKGAYLLNKEKEGGWLPSPLEGEGRGGEGESPFPILVLIVSGGHTQIVRMDGHGRYVQMGATRDDAAGEAFDKGARLLGLPYPGGPSVARLAETGDPRRIAFPRSLMGDSLDFSFSGVKTALRTFVQRDGGQTPLTDVAASYQAAIVDILITKMRKAARQTGIRTLCIAGGVAANRSLQNGMRTMCEQEGLRLVAPDPILCTDNAAMIACAGYFKLQHHGPDGLGLDTYASEQLALGVRR